MTSRRPGELVRARRLMDPLPDFPWPMTGTEAFTYSMLVYVGIPAVMVGAVVWSTRLDGVAKYGVLALAGLVVIALPMVARRVCAKLPNSLGGDRP